MTTVRCPTCNTKFKVAVTDAETKMSVKCPNGHDVALVKTM
jgi:phage FluMu protein Com